MWHIYNGILFSLKNEGNPDICNNVNNPGDIILNEINVTQKAKYCSLSLICGI
jgi:hypothetical protein